MGKRAAEASASKFVAQDKDAAKRYLEQMKSKGLHNPSTPAKPKTSNPSTPAKPNPATQACQPNPSTPAGAQPPTPATVMTTKSTRVCQHYHLFPLQFFAVLYVCRKLKSGSSPLSISQDTGAKP